MKQIRNIVPGLLLAAQLAAIDIDQMQINGYGVMNYYNYDHLISYQSAPERRAKIDMERFVLASKYLLDEKTSINVEIEYEKGGTGSTMEYDTLEEMGEFESEVEKGGEIILEELNIVIDESPCMKYRIGHVLVPVGMISQRHLPNLYYSAVRNRSEARVIPNSWHETGVELFGSLWDDSLHYQAQVINGLNSEYFDSAGWISGGLQKRYEYVNANNLAFAGRLDYGNLTGNMIGISLYQGGSGQNRHKRHLESEAKVTIVDIHTALQIGDAKLRALYLLGNLEESEAVTQANMNLPNATEAKRTAVAKQALAWFVEAGYNVSPMLGWQKPFDLFAKYDYSDTMHETEGSIQDNPRYEQMTASLGFNYTYSPNVIFKGEWAKTTYGLDTLQEMESYILGTGFQF